MKIKFLKGSNGDSIHIHFKDKKGVSRNILIDGGTKQTYLYKKKGKKTAGDLKLLIDKIKEDREHIDLLILTHVDDDHIGGVLSWLENDSTSSLLIKKVWFNSGRLIHENFNKLYPPGNDLKLCIQKNTDTSIKQGVIFEDFLEEHQIWDRRLICSGDDYKLFGSSIQILSPGRDQLKKLLGKWKKEAPVSDTTSENDYGVSLKELILNDVFEEDESIHNGSSIAFIFSHQDKKFLFLGDAHPNVIIDGLNSFGYSKENVLNVDLVKVAHHGSKRNTSYEFLKFIKTNKYVICTNGNYHQHPNKQCLSRIIDDNNSAKIYFNYAERISGIFSENDQLNYPQFKTIEVSEFEL